jgi:HD domain
MSFDPSRQSPRSVGRLEWLKETSGVLRLRDRATLVGHALVYGLTTLPAEARRLLGIRRRRVAELDIDRLSPPDSTAARAAESQLRDMSSPMVVNHSYRSYWWGALIAAHDGVEFDRELVYIASLMHDLYVDKPDALEGSHCFTFPAVQDVERLGETVGWEPGRTEVAAEAVTLHLNLIPPRVRPEAYAVFIGARLDITGFRLDNIGDENRTEILARYPRLDLKRETTPLFKMQSRENRGCRMDFYTRFLGANWFMDRAPFKE